MERIEGVFLAIREKGLEEIYNKLEIAGYERGAGGLKEWILDSLDEEVTQEAEEKQRKDRLQRTADFLTQHPEVVKAGIGVLKKVLSRR